MKYYRNARVEWLLSRSYGQGGTVALPSSSGGTNKNLLGDFPAGVQDILNKLIDQYASWMNPAPHETPVEWCFLIGGPGNGKSEALRVLADTLNVPLPHKGKGEPAPRTVPSTWPSAASPVVEGLEIAFLNDASIPRQESIDSNHPGSLFLDLVDGMNRLLNKNTPVILFGNVNRGILIEEAARLNAKHPLLSSEAGLIAEQIIKWILAPPTNVSPTNTINKLKTIVPFDPRKPYYAQFIVPLAGHGAKHDVRVHVVFLDALSLLEPTPDTGKGSIVFSNTGIPTIENYRPFGCFSDKGAAREKTVAGDLLLKIVNATEWENGYCRDPRDKTLCHAFNVCPFAQNTKWLRSLPLARNFLDTLRSAEITASRRLTYRDLLGHFSLAILGQLEERWLTGQHPCQWVEEKARMTQDTQGENQKSAVTELISHRIYNNLFPSPDTTAWNRLKVPTTSKDTVYNVAIQRITSENDSSRSRSFIIAFNDLDPARDVEDWGGVREQVLDAIESMEILDPSQELLEIGCLPVEAYSEIEKLVDQILPGEIAQELSVTSRRGEQRAKLLRKWRNTLLLRQVGLAIGQLAFKHALNLWLAEQENALRGGAPLELGKGVEALILPSTRKGEFLLAPLRPRTYSLENGTLPPNTVIVSVPLRELWVDIIPKGDMLTAEIQRRQGTRPIASLVIDLAIAREAALHADEQTLSFTEIGASAFARIERARASLVGRERLNKATTYFTDRLGDRYRVANNAVGPVPLKVIRE
ncbi:MAG: hypothetical protein H6650_05230 [Ardenticatenales bacterium]|nr:hypothetical protein [Ardenticatenales bacterium]